MQIMRKNLPVNFGGIATLPGSARKVTHVNTDGSVDIHWVDDTKQSVFDWAQSVGLNFDNLIVSPA